MEIVKIVVIGIVCAVVTVIVRQYRPDIAPFVQMSGIIAITVAVMVLFKDILGKTEELFTGVEIINEGYLELLVKVLGIAIVTKIASDICSDSGNSALATGVELGGKVLILSLCLSLLKTVAALAGGLLG